MFFQSLGPRPFKLLLYCKDAEDIESMIVRIQIYNNWQHYLYWGLRIKLHYRIILLEVYPLLRISVLNNVIFGCN